MAKKDNDAIIATEEPVEVTENSSVPVEETVVEEEIVEESYGGAVPLEEDHITDDDDDDDDDDDVTEEELLIEETISNLMAQLLGKKKHDRIQRATSAEKKKIYKKKKIDGSKKARDVQSEDIALTPEEVARKEYRYLLGQLEGKRATRVKLQKIETKKIDGKNPANNVYHVVGTLADESNPQYKIIIPSEALFPYDPTSYVSTDGTFSYLLNELEKRLHSVVNVHILGIDEADKIAIGSRISVMERMAGYNYREYNDRPAKIKKGMIQTATIVSTGRDRIRVFLGGVESILLMNEIAWLSCESLSEEFKAGQKINVVVKDIIPDVPYRIGDKEYHLAQVSLSAKEAQENPQKKYFNDFSVGDVVAGIVKKPTEKGHRVRLMNKLDGLGIDPAVGTVHEGDECIFFITSMDVKTHTIYGNINLKR